MSQSESQSDQLTEFEEVVATFVHDLSQPLSSVMNYMRGAMRRLEQGDVSTQELMTALQQAVQQGEHAASLVQRMRDFIHQPSVAMSYIDAVGLIRSVVQLMLPGIQKAGVSFNLDINLEQVFVLGDEIQLKRVLTNLVANALEAMRAEELPIKTLSLLAVQQADRSLLVTVKDTGCGIAEEKLAQIFMPFYTTKSKGMGMGLSICRSIVEKHHGKLWADAKLGSGAEFFLLLPTVER